MLLNHEILEINIDYPWLEEGLVLNALECFSTDSDSDTVITTHKMKFFSRIQFITIIMPWWTSYKLGVLRFKTAESCPFMGILSDTFRSVCDVMAQ